MSYIYSYKAQSNCNCNGGLATYLHCMLWVCKEYLYSGVGIIWVLW